MASSTTLFNSLEEDVKTAQAEGRPIDEYVLQQIKILHEAHDEFISEALANGYSLDNWKVGEIEVRQYSAMKQLAEKIGQPTDKYDKLIKDVQVRVFGEENYKRFFESE